MKQQLFVYCEDPPLQKKGFGLSVLGYNILTFLPQKSILAVFTYGNRSYCTPHDVLEDANWETILIDQGTSQQSWVKLPLGIRRIWQISAFWRNLPLLRSTLRRHPASPVLVNVGASAQPLWKAWLFKRISSNPVWLYIVDDLERINQISGNRLESFLVKKFLQKCLLEADRTLVISEGLKKKYEKQYAISSEVLLPCFAKVQLANIQTPPKKKYTFVFSGGLSILYNDTLQVFYQVISHLNQQKSEYAFRLIIQTYSSYAHYQALGFDEHFVEYRTSQIRSSNLPSLEEANCFLVPYSFDESNRDLVTTSFPQKVAELIQLKRPLLILGPSYSSVVQFFKLHHLPVVVDEFSLSSLAETILNLTGSRSDLSDLYASIYNKYFSQTAVISTLTSSGSKLKE